MHTSTMKQIAVGYLVYGWSDTVG